MTTLITSTNVDIDIQVLKKEIQTGGILGPYIVDSIVPGYDTTDTEVIIRGDLAQSQIDEIQIIVDSHVNNKNPEYYSISSNVKISQNLQVDGTETTFNTEEVTIEDHMIQINSSVVPPSGPAEVLSGIEVLRGTGDSALVAYDERIGETPGWKLGLDGALSLVLTEDNFASTPVTVSRAQLAAGTASRVLFNDPVTGLVTENSDIRWIQNFAGNNLILTYNSQVFADIKSTITKFQVGSFEIGGTGDISTKVGFNELSALFYLSSSIDLRLNKLDASKFIMTDANKNLVSYDLNVSNLVTLDGNQIITGTKTFSSTISGSISGNSATVSTPIIIGTQTNKASITYTADATRTYTIPNMGSNADFVMTAGSLIQTISSPKIFSGVMTFSASPIINNNIAIQFKDTGGTSLNTLWLGNDDNLYLSSPGYIRLRNDSGTIKWEIGTSPGDFLPGATKTYDIGSPAREVADIYCDQIISTGDFPINFNQRSIVGKSDTTNYTVTKSLTFFTSTDPGGAFNVILSGVPVDCSVQISNSSPRSAVLAHIVGSPIYTLPTKRGAVIHKYGSSSYIVISVFDVP